MSNSYKICGVANVGGNYKNIVTSQGNYGDKNIKEIQYATEFNEVEVLFGFADLNIVELDDDSAEVHNARIFLRDNSFAQGIVFLDGGFLIITDLTFFSAYTRIGGKEAPYTTLVESDTIEDEAAEALIEEDARLQ